MLVFRELKENILESSSLALGVFDGVHLGHQRVISDALKKSQKFDSTSTIVTFSKHPRCVISKTPPSMLNSLDERLKIFESIGVQAVVVLDFNEELSEMVAKDYLENILLKCLNPKSITIGYNHKFGGDKLGSGRFLEDYSHEHGFEVSVISPVKIDNHVVSSSAVRKFLQKGDVETAAKFLGRTFKAKGLVVHGQHLGRLLGFPTANLSIPDELIIPLSGVYNGLAQIDSKVYHAVINIGKRPTIGDLKKDLVEVHILNFNEDIYGKELEITFLSRIRDEMKFVSLDELKVQIEKDCEFVRSCE